MTTTADQKILDVQKELGTPDIEVKRKPNRETYLAQSSGDISFFMGDMQWPKKGSLDEFDDPIPSLYATVKGFTNKNNDFQRQIPLDGDLDSAKKMVKFWQDIVRFIQTTGVEIKSEGYVKDDIATAIDRYKKR